ncbi:MAG: hypothetical protein PHE51_10390 [Eubacteriales bacterium]|nr:hypothetical protein [Eubacteriales bacterium]
MTYEIKLKESSPFSTFCQRPLIQSDIKAYKVVIYSESSLEGCSIIVNAIKSNGQVVSDVGTIYNGYAEYTLAQNMYDVDGEMRLLITIVSADGSALTAKEIVFTVSKAVVNDAIVADDRVPIFNQLLTDCNKLITEITKFKNDYNLLVQSDNNFLDPTTISDEGSHLFVSMSLTAGTYAINVLSANIYSNTETVATYATADGRGTYFVITTDDYVDIRFSKRSDGKYMIVKGDTLPAAFKPYGVKDYLNDELLKSVYAEIDSVKPKLVGIEGNEVYLMPNTIGKMMISWDTTFHLPQGKTGDQILIMANVAGGQVIDWGTDYFFNGETPDIELGAYNFIFECDGGFWYAGAIPKGLGEIV